MWILLLDQVLRVIAITQGLAAVAREDSRSSFDVDHGNLFRFFTTHPVCQSTVVERDVRSFLSASKYYSNTARASRAVIASKICLVWRQQYSNTVRACVQRLPVFVTEIWKYFYWVCGRSAQVILARTVRPFGLQKAYIITYFFDSG